MSLIPIKNQLKDLKAEINVMMSLHFTDESEERVIVKLIVKTLDIIEKLAEDVDSLEANFETATQEQRKTKAAKKAVKAVKKKTTKKLQKKSKKK
ncbi:MAG TPA: hypothetical protein VJK05_02845 [archaeon]|nr:hypothetical protein [archaeon]